MPYDWNGIKPSVQYVTRLTDEDILEVRMLEQCNGQWRRCAVNFGKSNYAEMMIGRRNYSLFI